MRLGIPEEVEARPPPSAALGQGLPSPPGPVCSLCWLRAPRFPDLEGPRASGRSTGCRPAAGTPWAVHLPPAWDAIREGAPCRVSEPEPRLLRACSGRQALSHPCHWLCQDPSPRGLGRKSQGGCRKSTFRGWSHLCWRGVGMGHCAFLESSMGCFGVHLQKEATVITDLCTPGRPSPWAARVLVLGVITSL